MEAARRYELPKTLSPSTSSIIDQHRYNLLHSNGQHQEAIPEASDLLSIKADLESLLPSAERRNKDLKFGLGTIDHKSREMESTSGKSVNAMIEKMRIKQELEDDSDTHQNNTLSRNELSRQAALEQIKKKRRRESTDESIHRRSESPHLVKLKKLEGIPSLVSRSESPPASKPPKSNHDLKKAKKSAGRPQQQASESEDIDFVRVKPKDQVQIATFWAALEPYFRNLTEDDRQILLQKADQGKPYLIPPLGQHYLEKWTEEDQQTMQDVELLQPQLQQHKLKYLQSQQSLTDQHLMYDDLGCGTLTERLISSLVTENIINSDTEDYKSMCESDREDDYDAYENHGVDHKRHNAKAILLSEPPEEVAGFEERLKREL
ncbi:Chromatin-remodeling complexes subunit ngg1, partial [Choanephora cucurbitarum]